MIRFAPTCRACQLDFAAFNVGDGPAAFLTLVVGALITALALWLELALHPPFWVHAVIWIPVTIAAVILGLRAGKGALLAAEFRRSAGEFRRSAGEPRETAHGDTAPDRVEPETGDR